MEQTYESILQRMKEKYEECTGEAVRAYSDLDIRMSILADEVFSLLSYADFLRKGMFFDTASGAALDHHAAEHGISRLAAEKAVGRLAFSLPYTLNYDFIVPKGTICATSDGKLRYVTMAEGIIPSGSLMVQVMAESENGGAAYNIPSGGVNTVVTYFSVLMSVRSTSGFWGGADAESDESLRNRITARCQTPSNGLNETYYRAIALENEGVYSVSVHALNDETYNLAVVIAGQGNICSNTTYQAVRTAMEEKAPVSVSVWVENCTLSDMAVEISVTAQRGYTADTVKAAVENAIQAYFRELSVGESVKLSKIGDCVFHTEGVANYAFGEGMSDKEISYNQLVVCSNLTVTVTEG
ncbi:MAG: baseplate J/gp47 family protein [Acutalibacteraceae bacterium]